MHSFQKNFLFVNMIKEFPTQFISKDLFSKLRISVYAEPLTHYQKTLTPNMVTFRNHYLRNQYQSFLNWKLETCMISPDLITTLHKSLCEQ